MPFRQDATRGNAEKRRGANPKSTPGEVDG